MPTMSVEDPTNPVVHTTGPRNAPPRGATRTPPKARATRDGVRREARDKATALVARLQPLQSQCSRKRAFAALSRITAASEKFLRDLVGGQPGGMPGDILDNLRWAHARLCETIEASADGHMRAVMEPHGRSIHAADAGCGTLAQVGAGAPLELDDLADLPAGTLRVGAAGRGSR